MLCAAKRSLHTLGGVLCKFWHGACTVGGDVITFFEEKKNTKQSTHERETFAKLNYFKIQQERRIR